MADSGRFIRSVGTVRKAGQNACMMQCRSRRMQGRKVASRRVEDTAQNGEERCRGIRKMRAMSCSLSIITCSKMTCPMSRMVVTRRALRHDWPNSRRCWSTSAKAINRWMQAKNNYWIRMLALRLHRGTLCPFHVRVHPIVQRSLLATSSRFLRDTRQTW